MIESQYLNMFHTEMNIIRMYNFPFKYILDHNRISGQNQLIFPCKCMFNY